MNDQCEAPVFYLNAAIGSVAAGRWTTRMLGPVLAVNSF
jgi:hypothetical protein